MKKARVSSWESSTSRVIQGVVRILCRYLTQTRPGGGILPAANLNLNNSLKFEKTA